MGIAHIANTHAINTYIMPWYNTNFIFIKEIEYEIVGFLAVYTLHQCSHFIFTPPPLSPCSVFLLTLSQPFKYNIKLMEVLYALAVWYFNVLLWNQYKEMYLYPLPN